MANRPRVKWKGGFVLANSVKLPLIDRLRILFHGTVGFQTEVCTQFPAGNVSPVSVCAIPKIFTKENFSKIRQKFSRNLPEKLPEVQQPETI